jgi:hypothetical protein
VHGSAWRGAFPDAQEREQCTRALGNLVLVSKAQNDKAGNLEFARKHAIYFPSGDGAPLLAINDTCAGRSSGPSRPGQGSATRTVDEALAAYVGLRQARPPPARA